MFITVFHSMEMDLQCFRYHWFSRLWFSCQWNSFWLKKAFKFDLCTCLVDITLDPMTNHPWLQLSDDKRRVQEALNETEVSFGTQRFDSWPCVLGWEGLTSGRYYWEIDIANNGYWRIGVTTASSTRHGRCPMNPSEGFWTIWRSTRQFYACTKPETELPLSLVPKKLGVYLDYEEGQVSFYKVETRSHIFTFTANFREKLFPLFAPLDGRTLITLSSTEVTPEASSRESVQFF